MFFVRYPCYRSSVVGVIIRPVYGVISWWLFVKGIHVKLFWDVIERMPDNNLWNKGNIQATYLVWDLETTGFDPSINRIQQFGYLLVRDGKGEQEDAGSIYIKTPYGPRVYSAIYAQQGGKRMQFLTMARKAGCDLEVVKKAIDENDGSILGLDCVPEDIINLKAENGKRYFTAPVDVTNISSQTTIDEGRERPESIRYITLLMQKVCEKKWPIVGHNIAKFDVPFIEWEAKEFAGIDLHIDRELIIDTGMIIKASQSRTSLNKKESLESFYDRAYGKRSRAKWTLDAYCFDEFNLGKYGVDNTKQHDAKYDSWVNNCLLKELVA
jgi:hypothetical protein